MHPTLESYSPKHLRLETPKTDQKMLSSLPLTHPILAHLMFSLLDTCSDRVLHSLDQIDSLPVFVL